MRLFRPCFIARWIYPEAIFRIKTDEKLLFLTFDDGPDPDSTPVLIGLLDKYNVRAHFFCEGGAAEKYPDLVKLITSGGHILGNHGHSHLDGWITPTEKYVEDVSKAADFTGSLFFRPPFGRLKIGQYRKLKDNFSIVFWDLMPYDFDKNFSSESSLEVLKKRIRPGSIIVLHDKASSTANKIIGEFVNFAVRSGYRFEILE
jgi:peptidoglycan/xylan/chitin deacetylase (PgdA/CDA1 family)